MARFFVISLIRLRVGLAVAFASWFVIVAISAFLTWGYVDWEAARAWAVVGFIFGEWLHVTATD